MTKRDGRGLPITTASTEAAAHYCEGIDLLLSAWPGAAESFDAAIAADSSFALAHAARARMHLVRGETPAARSRIAEAARLAALEGSNRERSHVETLRLLANGEPAKALTAALEHLEDWPRDVLIFSLPMGAFGLLAFSGIPDHDQRRVDLCERHARHFGEDDWWFLTYRGWSHAENGAHELGRNLAERGLALRHANANAVHAVSHALHEAGEGMAAEALVDHWLPDYDRSGILHGHLAWHMALSALERGDQDQALAIYLRYVQPTVSKGMPVNIVSDAVSLLWRMQAYGYAVPKGLWEPLAAYAHTAFPAAGFAFADVHMGLLDAATGNVIAADHRVAALTALTEAGKLPAGPIIPIVCKAALAFAAEDYTVAASLLEPVATEVARIGGSGAQREIVEDMLLLALMRCGEARKAHALLDHRLHRRPSTRDARWRESAVF